MNKQEIFDKVWDHFIVQQQPFSYIKRENGSIACLYRGPDGAKCAFGVLIPDDLYRPEFEGRSVPYVLEISSPLRELLGIEEGYEGLPDSEFLGELQSSHDLVAEGYDSDSRYSVLEDRFRNIARNYKLAIPNTEVVGAD